MRAMGEPISTALMVGAGALQIGSGVAQAAGDARAAAFKGQQADAAARAGRVAAAETDTALRDELRGVISNIRAIGASSGVDPNSPTTAAIIANESAASERERRIRVANIERQADSDAASGRFFRQQGRDAFLYGSAGALSRGFSTLAWV